METQSTPHPPTDVLLALGAGKLDDATADAIFFHVEACPECLKTVGGQAGASFLDKLRADRGASGVSAPSKIDLSTFPPAGNTASILTTSEIPALAILPELRDHPQYEVLRELGRGGMGVVYLAKNKLMDRKEVLKVVNKQLLGDAGATERFLREIRSAAQLNHPNIVTAYSAVQAGELLLFSMEYIEGRDLAEVVKSRGPLPAAHSGSYVLQAARGLQHAFEKGMIHRDIKPQNLILDAKKNIVKILDFGLAKATRTTETPAEGLTGMNMMMGTPDYMAPEQARDAANVDIRADIYSLGCTLYCLLAGRAPFVGGSMATKIAAHQLKEPEPIESLRTDLPPGLAEIVRKMMAKDPTERYQKPEEVVQALTICFKGKGNQPTAKGSPVKVGTAKPAAAASKLAAKGEGKSIYQQQTVAPVAAPRQAMKERPSPAAQVKKEQPARQQKKWLIASSGAAVVLVMLGLIGLWAAGVFRVKTADGILVVQVNEPNAEVFVDGERATVSWDNGGKKAEVHVKPGARKVEVRKEGFSVDGTELTFKDGDRAVFTARLLPEQVAKTDAPPSEKPSLLPDAPPEKSSSPPERAPEKSPPPDMNKPDAQPAAGPAEDDKGFVPLFNGKDLAGWTGVNGTRPEWQVSDGCLEVVPGKADVWTKQTFGPDFKLHVEFWLPLMPNARGQARANSGVFLQGRYELQILDSYMNDTYPDGSVGALYRQITPDKEALQKAIRPPEQWQSYDVTFHAPRVDETGKVTAKGRITVVLNDIAVIKDGQFDKATPGGTEDKLGTPGPIRLQEHGAKVRFRNIKIKEITAEPSLGRAPGSLPLEAKEAAKAFEKSREDAHATLLADFDTVVDRLEKMDGSTDQRLKLINVVKEEKKRFENSGLIPWSEPMRPYLAKYFAAMSEAEDNLRRVYHSLIDAQLKAKNESIVADLQADLSNLLDVRVVARWREFMDGKPWGIRSLYSNGKIDNSSSSWKNTWSYAKGVLIQRWPNAKAPGGVFIATLKVSADGTKYAGTNNDPHSPKFTGVYLKGD